MATAGAGEDPFAKVKILIQELVDRLLKEAQNDQDHHNWCKTQTASATQSRDKGASQIKEFNLAMEKGESRRDKLQEEIDTLTSEMKTLTEEWEKMKEVREKEKEDNARAISDAKAGKEALETAIGVLRDFYDKAGKAAVEGDALVQQPDAPEAGFKNMEAYQGGQSVASGIFGMLEVIQSDFARTIATTEKNEKESNLAFIEAEGENRASHGKKEKLKDAAEGHHEKTMTQLNSDRDSLVDAQDLLDKKVQELMELDQACNKTGESYEDRVARREDEIEALKNALCILDKEGPVQTGECPL